MFTFIDLIRCIIKKKKKNYCYRKIFCRKMKVIEQFSKTNSAIENDRILYNSFRLDSLYRTRVFVLDILILLIFLIFILADRINLLWLYMMFVLRSDFRILIMFISIIIVIVVITSSLMLHYLRRTRRLMMQFFV